MEAETPFNVAANIEVSHYSDIDSSEPEWRFYYVAKPEMVGRRVTLVEYPLAQGTIAAILDDTFVRVDWDDADEFIGLTGVTGITSIQFIPRSIRNE